MNVESYNLAELAQTLFEECGDALFLFDPDTEQMLDVNPMAQRMTGHPRGALIRMPINYLFRGEGQGSLHRLRMAYRRTGTFHSQEGFFLRHQKEGLWIPVNLTVTRLHAEPKTLGLITARDITERRDAQVQLKKAEAELRQVLASISGSIWSARVGEGGRWESCYFSPVIEKITGRPAEHFQSGPDSMLELVHSDDRACVERALRRLQHEQSDREEVEFRIVHADRVVRWVRDSIMARRSSSGGLLRLDAILTDVTERKREEILLQARRSVLELIAGGADLNEVLQRLVSAIEEQLPDSRAVIHVFSRRGGPATAVADPTFAATVLRRLGKFDEAGDDASVCSRIQARLVEAAASHRFERCWSRPIRTPAHEPPAGLLGLISVFSRSSAPPSTHDEHLLDLAGQLAAIAVERHRAEEALRVSEARSRSLIENLEQCVFLKDRDFRFVAVNEPFCRAVGAAREALLDRTDFEFYPPELAEKFREDDRKVLLTGRKIEVEEESMLNGERRTVRVVKTPVRESGGRISGVLGIFWDVTEQRSLEAQLRQAQKMEAIGQLAGGVAHDFNNLLTAILGNLSLMSTTAALDESSREMLHAAETATLRAANLTGQMLGFARRKLLRREPASLNLLVTEVVSLLKRTIDPRIVIETRLDENLAPFLGDTGLVNQVLMNLCLNARDAMPDGGRLVLRTENVSLNSEHARVNLDARPGEFVCLSVADTGMGMDEDVRTHLFEPFFTTKGPGKGTGLGLATVFGIVKQHEGWIECDSEPGQGTIFRVHLPRMDGNPADDAVNDEDDVGTAEGSETILFVDDEPSLRILGQTILKQHGYHVLLAEDGIEALEIHRRHRDRIGLVILDLTMPRLSGADTFRALRALDPDVPVLFASGYAREQVTSEELDRSAGFVSKPYRPRDLLKVVRESLDRAGPPDDVTEEAPRR